MDGQDQYVKVDSFRRVPDVTMECGSYVLLSTTIGEFKLDTTHIWLNGVRVQADGSFGLGSFAKGRKLKAIDLLAFYDEVDDIKFECTLSWNDVEGQCLASMQGCVSSLVYRNKHSHAKKYICDCCQKKLKSRVRLSCRCPISA